MEILQIKSVKCNKYFANSEINYFFKLNDFHEEI